LPAGVPAAGAAVGEQADFVPGGGSIKRYVKMGLDLYHAVPSAKTDETLEYLTMDQFRERPDFVERYKHLITEVSDVDTHFKVLIFPSVHIKTLYSMHHRNHQDEQDKRMLIGNLISLENEIRKLEVDHKLDPVSQLVRHETDATLSQKYGLAVSYDSLNYSVSGQTKWAIYWISEGYQWDGMNRYFYNHFENCKLYFDKANVIKASRYLSPPSIYGAELKAHFQENFLDNFIEGESIFFASW
jgi:hypothetical protein